MKKVMVIDDDKEFLEEIGSVLEDSSYKVISVPYAGYALSYMHRIKPDIILLDLRMSGVNGFQVAEELKGSNIPILVITGCELNKQDKLYLQSMGVSSFIIKPVYPVNLIFEIDRILSSHTNVAS